MLSLNFFSPPPSYTKKSTPPSKEQNTLYPCTLKAHEKRANKQNIIYPISSKSPQVFSSSGNKDIEGNDGNLPQGLHLGSVPKHAALIVDGHRRWAVDHGLPWHSGYRCIGLKTKMLANLCADLGIEVFSVYWLSTENMSRRKGEVDFLLGMFQEILESDLDEYSRRGIKISSIGARSGLPMSLQNAISVAEETTKDNTGLHLVVGLNYGGRRDIAEALKGIATKVSEGVVAPDEIDESFISKELGKNCCKIPDPDLLIRTGGEQRLSNFMLWQSAFTELYFPKKKFPDFEESDFIDALIWFQGRCRRFGA